MINHEFRCLYIHIPKTAGNSINRAFGNGWEDHKDLRRYAAELTAATFDDYYKFAIVRNPWDRLFSDYHDQKKKSRAPESKLSFPVHRQVKGVRQPQVGCHPQQIAAVGDHRIDGETAHGQPGDAAPGIFARDGETSAQQQRGRRRRHPDVPSQAIPADHHAVQIVPQSSLPGGPAAIKSRG